MILLGSFLRLKEQWQYCLFYSRGQDPTTFQSFLVSVSPGMRA